MEDNQTSADTLTIYDNAHRISESPYDTAPTQNWKLTEYKVNGIENMEDNPRVNQL